MRTKCLFFVKKKSGISEHAYPRLFYVSLCELIYI